MKNRYVLAFGLCTALASLVPSAPAVAAMDLSTVDCSKAPSMMMMHHDSSMMAANASPMPAMTPMASMTTDQAFGAMAHDMMMHGTMMAGVELKCGTDPKARAMAAKLLGQLRDDGMMEAQDILNTYNH